VCNFRQDTAGDRGSSREREGGLQKKRKATRYQTLDAGFTGRVWGSKDDWVGRRPSARKGGEKGSVLRRLKKEARMPKLE